MEAAVWLGAAVWSTGKSLPARPRCRSARSGRWRRTPRAATRIQSMELEPVRDRAGSG